MPNFFATHDLSKFDEIPLPLEPVAGHDIKLRKRFETKYRRSSGKIGVNHSTTRKIHNLKLIVNADQIDTFRYYWSLHSFRFAENVSSPTLNNSVKVLFQGDELRFRQLNADKYELDITLIEEEIP